MKTILSVLKINMAEPDFLGNSLLAPFGALFFEKFVYLVFLPLILCPKYCIKFVLFDKNGITMDIYNLPTNDEILFALGESPLGEGAEATVFKIHTHPKYTIRVSNNFKRSDAFKYLQEAELHLQKNIFGHRNFAQTVAYFWHPTDIPEVGPKITINYYCPGFSYEIYKPGRPMPDAEEALIKTRLMSEKILEIPDKAIDEIYDDLHFLSSREHSIDVGGGLFTNTGNILFSALDQRLFIIDLQPFLEKGRYGTNPQNTKGFNTPLYLTRGLMPGMERYRDEHSKDHYLINLRTEILDKVISGAERNNLNDEGGYLSGSLREMEKYWRVQFALLKTPEKYQENMLKRLLSIKDKPRYRLHNEAQFSYMRVSGKSLNT